MDINIETIRRTSWLRLSRFNSSTNKAVEEEPELVEEEEARENKDNTSVQYDDNEYVVVVEAK